MKLATIVLFTLLLTGCPETCPIPAPGLSPISGTAERISDVQSALTDLVDADANDAESIRQEAGGLPGDVATSVTARATAIFARIGERLRQIAELSRARGEVETAGAGMAERDALIDSQAQQIAVLERDAAQAAANQKRSALWTYLAGLLVVVGVAGLVARLWIPAIPLGVSILLGGSGLLLGLYAVWISEVSVWIIGVVLLVAAVGFVFAIRDNIKKLDR